MKKILALLGAISLTATASSSVIACSTSETDKLSQLVSDMDIYGIYDSSKPMTGINLFDFSVSPTEESTSTHIVFNTDKSLTHNGGDLSGVVLHLITDANTIPDLSQTYGDSIDPQVMMDDYNASIKNLADALGIQANENGDYSFNEIKVELTGDNKFSYVGTVDLTLDGGVIPTNMSIDLTIGLTLNFKLTNGEKEFNFSTTESTHIQDEFTLPSIG